MKASQALQILEILEKWCHEKEGRIVRFYHATDWHVELIVSRDEDWEFRGVSLQDALAQAAQVAELEDS